MTYISEIQFWLFKLKCSTNIHILPPSQNICCSRFPRNNFNKIYIKKYYYLWYIISIIGKIFESSFLINLFGDTNVARIFYKSSQTCGTHTNGDSYLGTEGVYLDSHCLHSLQFMGRWNSIWTSSISTTLPHVHKKKNKQICLQFADSSRGLDWKTCYQIIKGIWEGLHCLHRKKIVHLDLKPANILLDCNMVPKIADFGLSRCFDEEQTQTITAKLVGTL